MVLVQVKQVLQIFHHRRRVALELLNRWSVSENAVDCVLDLTAVELSINRHFDHRFRAASSLNWQPVMTTHLPMLTIPSQHTLCQNKPQLARLNIY